MNERHECKSYPVRQQQRADEEGVEGADAQVHSVRRRLPRIKVV